jgi:DNA adenine methylase
MSEVINNIDSLLEAYPNTRYMGSKRKVLQFLNDVISDLEFETCLDAFSGSGVVSYYFKRKGKKVYSNDFMRFPYMYTLATIENESTKLLDSEVDMLLNSAESHNQFIKETFGGLYFSDADNVFLDKIRNNINHLSSEYTQAIALSALVRSCLKKRPRGIFTYVGDKYNDGRLDLQKSMEEHFLENIDLFNNAVFSNGQQNMAYNRDVFELDVTPDLVYLDPPYFSKSSDNDYSRRYHFVEGLVRNWEGLEIQNETKTKKFKRLNSSFDTKIGTYAAFEAIFKRYQDSIIVVSYSSNSLPSKDEMIAMMKKHKKEVRIYEMDYLYSFGNQSSKVGDNANRVQEFIFVGI